MRRRILASGVLAGLALFSCTTDKSVTPDPVKPEGVLEETYSYTINGDTLIAVSSRAGQVDTTRSCDTTVMLMTFDTVKNADTARFVIHGDTLILSRIIGGFADPAASITWYSNSLRLDGTGAVLGLWQYLSCGYTVASGVVTDSEKVLLDFMVGEQNLYNFQTEVTPTQFKTWAKSDEADVYIYYWNNRPIDTANIWDANRLNEDVTLARASSTEVTVTGNKSHEVVTLTWVRGVSMTYTSSDTGHHPHVYYDNPATCPNEGWPNWMMAFYDANYIPPAKRLAGVPFALPKRTKNIF